MEGGDDLVREPGLLPGHGRRAGAPLRDPADHLTRPVTATHRAPQNLLDRLHALFPQSSRRTLKQWLGANRVRVNGSIVRGGHLPLTERDCVSIAPHAPPEFPRALRLVYEDADLLVIDKPPGLLTIGTETERARTAYRLLFDYVAAQRPPRRLFIVHRLDRETSGLLAFAKTAAAKRSLQAQFEQQTVGRVYVALVDGVVREPHGTLECRLVSDRGLRVRPTRNPRLGKRAITHYRVLERGRQTTLIELTLGTGRRRQIRVQLAQLGHPIVGDLGLGSGRDPLKRVCLHATRLQFIHPISAEPTRFESPVPAGFGLVGRRSPEDSRVRAGRQNFGR